MSSPAQSTQTIITTAPLNSALLLPMRTCRHPWLARQVLHCQLDTLQQLLHQMATAEIAHMLQLMDPVAVLSSAAEEVVLGLAVVLQHMTSCCRTT